MNEIKPPPRSRGIYLLPNLFTTAGLFAGFFAIIAAANGQFVNAAVAAARRQEGIPNPAQHRPAHGRKRQQPQAWQQVFQRVASTGRRLVIKRGRDDIGRAGQVGGQARPH